MSGILLACSRSTLSSRRQAVLSLASCSTGRLYSSTRPTLEEEATATKKTGEDKKALREAALEYGRRRAAYKRQVSQLRRGYMEEYKQHKKEDEALRDAELAEKARSRLERQRAKNERSVQNAIRQEELRRQTQLAWEDHLRVQQERRDEKKKLLNRARQLLIDELEEEAPLWLTSREEVEAAFTPEAEQLLWARPQGVLGVPNPSLDSHFWHYETHTWDMSKTYKTHADILLENMEDEAYEGTNVDPQFWTPERIQAHEEIERKAKLRANVRTAGRKSLLKRQKEYLEDEGQTEEGEAPKAKPIPSVAVLGDIRAQENEGAKMLFEDPTKFFVFDRNQETQTESEGGEGEGYSGPSLGVPVELYDPLRTDSPQGNVFPIAIGKLPKPDTRTEKEKKRQEREDRLWAAAQEQEKADMDKIDMAADEDMDFGEPLDYDNNTDWDSDDEEWMKGLDPERDADLINMPREQRIREEDIDSVIEKLEKKAREMESHLNTAMSSLEKEEKAKSARISKLAAAEVAFDSDTESTQTGASFFDRDTSEALQSLGADLEKLESVVSSLSSEQVPAVVAAEGRFEKVPGLTEEQKLGLKELYDLLSQVDDPKKS